MHVKSKDSFGTAADWTSVDLVFLLVVYFAAITQTASRSPISLPTAVAGKTVKQPNVQLVLDADGSIYFSDARMTAFELADVPDAVEARKSDLPADELEVAASKKVDSTVVQRVGLFVEKAGLKVRYLVEEYNDE